MRVQLHPEARVAQGEEQKNPLTTRLFDSLDWQSKSEAIRGQRVLSASRMRAGTHKDIGSRTGSHVLIPKLRIVPKRILTE